MPEFHKGYPAIWKKTEETECGSGSEERNMRQVIKHLPRVLYSEFENDQFSVIELGCGDMNFASKCGLHVPNIQYTGYDILERDSWKNLPPNARGEVADISNLEVIRADVVVVRDVFIHLPTPLVKTILSRIISRLLVSTLYVGADNSKRNTRPDSQFYPIDLRTNPFNLSPDLLIQEHAPNKYLGVFINDGVKKWT